MSAKQPFQLVGFILLFGALLSGSSFLWLFGGLLLFLPAAQEWWLKRIDRWLHVEWSADQSRVMPGTAVHVTVRLHNRSWLPLPATWLRVTLPDHVTVTGAAESSQSKQRTYIRLRFDVPARKTASLPLVLTPHKRGVVWLTDVECETIPLFIGEPGTLTLPLSFSLLVYPQPLPLPPLAFDVTEPDGSSLSRQRQQEDMTFLRGVRPYFPGDRIKNMHWKATAKTNTLQTRLFEHTARANWKVVGHILPSYEPALQRHNYDDNERTISYLAAISVYCRRHSLRYELLLTVKQRGRELYHLPAGSGKSHHLHVMTSLAQLHHYFTTPLASLLRRLEDSSSKDAILLVTPRPDENVHASVERLRRRGHRVAVLDISGEQPVLHRYDAFTSQRRKAVAP